MSSFAKSNTNKLMKSMFQIGSAQIFSTLMSIIKMKGIAIILGPSGLGLLSIFNSFFNVGQQVTGLGMKVSAVRKISSHHDIADLNNIKRVLFIAHMIQGLCAMSAVWFFREKISILIFGDTNFSNAIGIIGISVLIALINHTHIALLQGTQRIRDLGRITILASLISTMFGLLAIFFAGQDGLICFIFIQPFVAAMISYKVTRNIGNYTSNNYQLAHMLNIWKSIVTVGISIMAGTLFTTFTIFFIRAYISDELGLNEVGYFAAAWGISITYLGPFMASLGSDFYPRISKVIHNKSLTSKLINDQTQLNLSINGPLILLIIGLAPWIITILYSKDFSPATAMLQYQIIGNLFKITEWSFSFVHLSAGKTKLYLINSLFFNIVFLLVVLFLLPIIGILAAGIAFTVAHLLSMIFNIYLIKKFYNISLSGLSIKLLIVFTILAISLFLVALKFPIYGAYLSLLLASITIIFSLRIVLTKIGSETIITNKLLLIFDKIGWPIKKNV